MDFDEEDEETQTAAAITVKATEFALTEAARAGHAAAVGELISDTRLSVGRISSTLIEASTRGDIPVVSAVLQGLCQLADPGVVVTDGVAPVKSPLSRLPQCAVARALVVACQRGSVETVNLLAPWCAHEAVGQALVHCAYHGLGSSTAALLSHHESGESAAYIGRALGAAAVRGHVAVLELILAHHEQEGQLLGQRDVDTALRYASRGRDHDKCRRLLLPHASVTGAAQARRACRQWAGIS